MDVVDGVCIFLWYGVNSPVGTLKPKSPVLLLNQADWIPQEELDGSITPVANISLRISS